MGKETDLGTAISDSLVTRKRIYLSGEQAAWAANERVSQNPSSNHSCLGLLADLSNLVHGYPTVLNHDKQRQKSLLYAKGPIFSKESLTRIHYHGWNAEPYRTARILWGELGDTEVQSAYYEACRAYIAYLALGSFWVPSRSLSRIAEETKGPACITADGSPIVQSQLPSVTCCGARSAVNYGFSRSGYEKHWIGWLPSSAQFNLYSAVKFKYNNDKYGRSLLRRGGDYFWLTQEDAAIVDRAMRGDGSSIETLVHWASKRTLSRKFRFLRTSSYVATVNTVGPPSSKATLYACVAMKDTGIHKFLVADPGGADTGARDPDVEGGHAEVASDLSYIRAQRDSHNLPSAKIELPFGELELDFESGPDPSDFRINFPSIPVSPPPPPPEPDPEPTNERWHWLKVFLGWLRNLFGRS